MNKANECTCPSGDGSLVHPCPAHPAVEQAGGDERAAFEAAFAAMGRPVCRADYDQDAYGTPFDDGGWTGWQARAALAQPSQSQYEASFEEWLANELEGEDGQPVPAAVCDIALARRAFNHWPKLEQPAKVGGVRFSAGVSSRLVVEAAQRLYEFESTPEKEAERIEQLQAFREQLDPLNLAPHAEAFNEAPAEALKSDQAEAERPEADPHIPAQTIAEAAIEQLIKSGAEHYEEFHFDVHIDGHEGERPVVVTVAFSDGPSAHELRMKAEQQRDAALARVAELEKQEPVAHLRASDLERLNQPGIAGSAGSLWNGPREGFVPLYAAPVAQAQHSVPETTNEEANSFLRVADAGQFKDNAAAVRTAAMIIRGLQHRPAIMKSIIRHRIGLTPEYEGQWHADMYGEDGEVQHHAEADTPDEAVRAVVALAAAPGKEGV
ncbi:TPA: hypothetical protein NO005_002690 [Pseudomonas aeruginosa]|nr:hypothetical protein [Pseudomonas aeruginosa]HCH7763630.1 hypothetical protein [Pseudomonas aeruginosa]HCI3516375.1 hypothetical protein [Pseudomonas aeruginosa]HCI7130594.1 hypothetical protein [Pseudomonas aeruginosa]HCJ0533491.1 hypothetical protein [Pseudomonas aeruginosa]